MGYLAFIEDTEFVLVKILKVFCEMRTLKVNVSKK